MPRAPPARRALDRRNPARTAAAAAAAAGQHDWKCRGISVSSDHGRINMRTGMQVGLLYEQSDPNDLVDYVVMTPDRFIFRVV